MKKLLLLSFFSFFFFNQNLSATPVAVVELNPVTEKVETTKKHKKKKKRFLDRLGERMLKKKIGKAIKKLGLYPMADSTKCDLLIKSNGDEMKVRIIEVGVGEVKYKKCDYEEGPTFSLNKKAIFMIKYTDGGKDVFKNIETVNEDGLVMQRASIENESSGGFGAGFVLGALLSLLGLLIVAIAYKGSKRKRAVRGALVGMLAIILLILASG